VGKDDGKGKLGDYKYDLLPANRRVTMVLAGSDPFQDELERISGLSEPQAFISRRTIEEERTDAPVAVRVFGDSRMSSIVGYVPRGLEAPIFEALARLEKVGQTRIPARIERTRAGLRLVLLMGLTR
jgi:hypothetical protein